MMVLVALFGGVALMLYGIRLTGEGLQRAAGNRLRSLLTGMSRNRFLAMASGATITGIIQSSSATIVMLIGFVAAGLMTFRQTLGVILGADIGTTFTVQLIDQQEKLHSLEKKDIRTLEVQTVSPMPSFNGKLTTDELSDVIAYLITLKG